MLYAIMGSFQRRGEAGLYMLSAILGGGFLTKSKKILSFYSTKIMTWTLKQQSSTPSSGQGYVVSDHSRLLKCAVCK